MDGSDALTAADRAALEAAAFGGSSDPAAAEAARRELERRAGDHRDRELRERALAPTAVRDPAPEPESDVPPAPPAPSDGTADRLEVPVPAAGPAARPGRRLRLAALVLGTALVAAALGVTGTVVLERYGPTIVPDGSGSDGTGVRLSRVLAAERTGVDRLPTTMIADVDRSTTHVIYETYPGQPPVRWRVWVATARGGAEVCFVVSSDGYASDVTCTSRAEALGGVVQFITRDGGEGLSLLDEHGTVGIDLVGVD